MVQRRPPGDAHSPQMYVPVGVMAACAWPVTGCSLVMRSRGVLEGEMHSELDSETTTLEGLYD